jgi:hypothetical protein
MIDPIREANIGQPGIEADEHGDPVGKDPRQVDQAELRACIITSCALGPYRIGSNPWRAKKTLSPEYRSKLIASRKIITIRRDFRRRTAALWRSPISAAAP